MAWNITALIISIIALGSSTSIAVRQATVMSRANHLPAYLELISQFRSLEFNDHYQFITVRLAAEYDPQRGISGLPDEARAAIYDVGALFQWLATLRLLRVIDDRIDAMVQVRTVRTWEALAPFVRRERELQGLSEVYLWRAFEEFAADSAKMPTGAINLIIARDRRARSRRLRFTRLTSFKTGQQKPPAWRAILHAKPTTEPPSSENPPTSDGSTVRAK